MDQSSRYADLSLDEEKLIADGPAYTRRLSDETQSGL